MNHHLSDEPETTRILRHRLHDLVLKFDRQDGHFHGLNYISPLDLVTRDSAERSGRSVADIQTALTYVRAAKIANLPPNPEQEQVVAEWITSTKAWLEAIGYRRAPVRLGAASRFRNSKYLQNRIEIFLKDLGLETHNPGSSDGFSTVTAIGRADIGRNFLLSFEIARKYDGKLRSCITFIHQQGERSFAHIDITSDLMGRMICVELGIDPPRGMTLFAETQKGPSPSTDLALDITAACIKYLSHS